MPDSLPPEDEIARLRGENDQGASPAGSGSQASPEAPSDLRPEGFDPSRVETEHEALLKLQEDLRSAKKADRALDQRLADILPRDLRLNGRRLGDHLHALCFTRDVINAATFIHLAFPNWDWTVGSQKARGNYYATVWGPTGSDDDGTGATPALALLVAALKCRIEEGCWSVEGH